MRKKKNKWLIGFVVFVVLVLLSLSLGLFTNLEMLESFRIVFGSIYVLFLPGFIISFIFFPKTKKLESNENEGKKGDIDWIERIALSFALSIAIVPLTVFYLNLIGLKINILNSSLTIFGIIIISLGILFLKSKKGL